MKIKISFVFTAVCATVLACTVAFAGESLYETYSRQREVKVFVAEPTFKGGTSPVSLQAYRQALIEALKNRKSIRFAVVESSSQGAQLTVESEVLGFRFSESDPVDMLMGVGPAAMDAATQEHFATMETRFVVKKNGSEVIWTDTVRGSATDATMTERESHAKVFEKSAAMFVRQAFGKKR